MNATSSKAIASLPNWAFKVLAQHAIETLIDRAEHEIIVITRRIKPDLVLMSHDDWDRLTAAPQRAGEASTEPEEIRS